ncbi:hypothetical protein QBC42DRAFT_257846 [Cladorrhinum samala]|uniref:CFEM domain-containing protein n=1 Tax=Cladorrhinum samala TaxID=585594 RepID=A0AAV9I456_9PEZI|nr:hypothetical protein QBC42DRAFT_257846 [Cladorrhinum samala]
MRPQTAFLLNSALLTLTCTAQDLKSSNLPSCSHTCILNSITSGTPCESASLSCGCKYQVRLIQAATPCIIQSCGQTTETSQILQSLANFCTTIPDDSGSGSPDDDDDDDKTRTRTTSVTKTETKTTTTTTSDPQTTDDSDDDDSTSTTSSRSVSVTATAEDSTASSSEVVTTTIITTTTSINTGAAEVATSTTVSTAGAAVVKSMGLLGMFGLGVFAAL